MATAVIKSGYWMWNNGDNLPAAINGSLLTHMYYAFALPRDNYKLQVDRASATTFTNALHRKNPPVKTIISIGGWSGYDKTLFPRMASQRGSRSIFIESAITTARDYGFDGIDLDWEFPEGAMANFGLLLDELRAEIQQDAMTSGRPRLLLTAAVYYSTTVDGTVANTYPIQSIIKNMDWINLMTYGYCGNWDPPLKTGMHTALRAHNNVSTESAIRSWMTAGVPKSKLVMGLALYGRVWKLRNPIMNGVGAPAVGLDGLPEELPLPAIQTQTANWLQVPHQLSGSTYTYSGQIWIGYDTRENILEKEQYGRDLGIRGYFFWCINHDDALVISTAASNAWP